MSGERMSFGTPNQKHRKDICLCGDYRFQHVAGTADARSTAWATACLAIPATSFVSTNMRRSMHRPTSSERHVQH